MGNVEQKNNIDNNIEVIDTETIQLKETSKRYISNKKALFIAKKYEKRFEEIWKKYDIDIAVDKKTWLYYIIFWENPLDIWLDINELDNFLNILLIWFQWKSIMGKKELKKYDIPQKSKIWNFIRKVSWERFNDPLYNKPSDGKQIAKSRTEENIEKKVRKLEIKEITFNGAKYNVLRYWENTIFGLQQIIKKDNLLGPYATWNSVKFKETELLKITKDVIEWRRSIESITKDEIMIRISSQSKIEVPIAEQKKQELQRFKNFLTACINLKEYQSYPISFWTKE